MEDALASIPALNKALVQFADAFGPAFFSNSLANAIEMNFALISTTGLHIHTAHSDNSGEV